MYEDITMLINVTDAIYDNYIALVNLEISGNKKESEYRNLLKGLKHEISVFDNILNRISPNYQMGLQAYEYLISLDRFKKSPLASNTLKLSFITKLDERDEIVLTYIKNRLYQRLFRDSDYILATAKGIPEEMQDDAIIGDVKKILAFKSEYQYSIINDIYTLFLTIIASSKDKTSSKNILDKFTKIKYSYSLILPSIEEYLVNRNFDVAAKPFIFHHTVASLYQVSESAFATCKREIILNVVAGNLEVVKYLNDRNFLDYQKLALVIDIEATIRSCLAVADKETRDIILNLLNSLISSLQSQYGYQTIAKILKKIPEKTNDDLSLMQVISIGRV